MQIKIRRKSEFFVTFDLPEGYFLNILVLSQCIVYSINFQNIYIFTYQKTLLHTLLLLVLKSSKAFSVSLIRLFLSITDSLLIEKIVLPNQTTLLLYQKTYLKKLPRIAVLVLSIFRTYLVVSFFKLQIKNI